jgi:hypothetical protein
MVGPSVSQLRPRCPALHAGIGNFQAQRVSHFPFFRLQVGERVRCGHDLAGEALDDVDAGGAKRTRLARFICQQANAGNAKVVQDRGR